MFELLEEGGESLLVLVPDGGHQGGDDLAHVRDHGERERDPDDCEEDAEQPARRGDRREVAIPDGGEDRDHEEDCLDQDYGGYSSENKNDIPKKSPVTISKNISPIPCLAVVPVDAVVLAHDVNPIVDGLQEQEPVY